MQPSVLPTARTSLSPAVPEAGVADAGDVDNPCGDDALVVDRPALLQVHEALAHAVPAYEAQCVLGVDAVRRRAEAALVDGARSLPGVTRGGGAGPTST